MTVQITDIATFRDGGSIEFFIERDGIRKRVLLDTPLKGEPRTLMVDAVKLKPHSEGVDQLLRDLDNWHASLPHTQRLLIEEVLQKIGPYINADEAVSRAIDLSNVTFVQRYLRGAFLQPGKPPPPLTDELRAEAKRHPNGWVYVIDPTLVQGERVPPTAIVGAWHVDAEGQILEDGYQPNTRYRGTS